MTPYAKLLGSIFGIAAIIIVSSPMRTFAHDGAQLLTKSGEGPTTEFSAGVRKQHAHRVQRAHKFQRAHRIQHARKFRHARNSSKMSRHHRMRNVGSRAHKSYKLSNTASSTYTKFKVGNTSKGAVKLRNGPGKLSNGLVKLRDGPGKAGNGAAKTDAASNGTDSKTSSAAGSSAGQGRVYMENMGTTSNTSPTTPDPQQATAGTKNKQRISEKVWIEKHAKAMERNRIKFPNEDPSKLSDRIEEAMGKIYIKEDEPKVRPAPPPKTMTEEERRAYWEAARKDHEDTNRKKAEQQENNNPNAEKYRPSGLTDTEHNELNQRSLPGKPNGTE